MAKFKLQPEKTPVQRTISLQRYFSYTKGEMNLSFTLTLNSKKIKDFKECLLLAIKDVDETIQEVKEYNKDEKISN